MRFLQTIIVIKFLFAKCSKTGGIAKRYIHSSIEIIINNLNNNFIYLLFIMSILKYLPNNTMRILIYDNYIIYKVKVQTLNEFCKKYDLL